MQGSLLCSDNKKGDFKKGGEVGIRVYQLM